jgi:hypothetical protein
MKRLTDRRRVVLVFDAEELLEMLRRDGYLAPQFLPDDAAVVAVSGGQQYPAQLTVTVEADGLPDRYRYAGYDQLQRLELDRPHFPVTAP